MSRVLYRLGGFAAGRPWRMIGIWAVVVAVFVGLAGGVGGALHDDYELPGTGSHEATGLLRAEFPAFAEADARVVIEKDGLDQAAVARAVERIRGLEHVREVAPPVPGKDGRFALITVRYDVPVTDLTPKKAVADLEGAVDVPGAQVEFGGQVPENVSAPSGTGEVVGILAALVILLLAFGSVVAAGLPLAVALTGLGVGMSGVTLLAAVTDVSTITPTIAVMVGLGVGIDYALFVLTRHREGLAAGLAPREAAARANETAGKSVVFAGVTVLIALSGLALSGLPVFVTMGFATGIVVAATMFSAITLLPALLGLSGRRVLRRRERRGAPVALESKWVGAWAARVGRRPLPWLLASLLVMLALAAPVLGMRTWPSDASSEPSSNTVRRAYDLVAEGYGPGANGPLLVAVDLRKTPDAAGLQAELGRIEGVASVTPPQTSPSGNAAVLTVVPEFGPQDERASALIRDVRAVVTPRGAEVTGLTAVYHDLGEIILDRLWMVILAVIGTSFVLLLLVFRSLVVPAKAALMNLLSIGAAYGVVTAVFQWGWGAQALGLPHSVPVSSYLLPLMFTMLFGVSMDYEVFLLSRVREDYERTGDARGSVVTGLASTGRIISSAALIMVAVFAGFVLDTSVVVKQMGVGLAVAVALDATLVRLVLVPSTMALLGSRNWWLPGFLARLLPARGPAATASDLELVH